MTIFRGSQISILFFSLKETFLFLNCETHFWDWWAVLSSLMEIKWPKLISRNLPIDCNATLGGCNFPKPEQNSAKMSIKSKTLITFASYWQNIGVSCSFPRPSNYPANIWSQVLKLARNIKVYSIFIKKSRSTFLEQGWCSLRALI